MTNVVEPRGAATGDDARGRSSQDGELTTLVRRWMAVGTRSQDRVRREGNLRVAPDPVSEDVAAGEDVEDDASDLRDDVVIPIALRGPALPQRTVGAEPRQASRVALLVDARRVSVEVATGVLAWLSERGSVSVCRAYADWSRSDLDDWVRQMRREGLHSFHHFSDDDDQALVAMTIDAVDIARDAAVDEVVIAGDLTSALPLVHRLHAAGVRVVAVGAGNTPHDVRAACHEFIDTGSLDGMPVVSEGRHRA